MSDLRRFLSSIGILLLALSFSWLYAPPLCSASEKTYLITESQLTALETNLTTLQTQNKELQEQLKKSEIQVQTLQTQSEQLKKQVQDLTQSLNNAKALLSKYETSQQNKNYAIGLGVSNNSIALNADYKKVWLFVDTDTVAIGYKYKF